MIEIMPSPNDKSIGFRLSGRLHDEDYKTFVPLVDEATHHAGLARLRTAGTAHPHQANKHQEQDDG